MEYIKKIEISNYKSIKHLVIDDCKKINLFIGYPNVGKSNILEALSLISRYTKKENLKEFCRHQSYFNLFHLGNIHDPIQVKLNDRLNLEFKYIDQINYKVDYFKISENGRTSSISPAAEIENNNIKKYHYNGTHNNSINSNEKYLSIPYGENLFNMFQINKQLRLEAGDLFRNYDFKLNVDLEKNELRIQRQVSEDTIFSIPYSLSADTIQRVLFYSAAIFTNENSILLFEEPEAHLFPPYIKKITTEIIFDERNNQYFINTHSPYVLSAFLEEDFAKISVYVVYYKGESLVKKLSEIELREILNYDMDLFYNLESFIK